MAGVEPTEELRKELVAWVRKEIGPIASPDLIQFAPGLPKTRSGKIMRRILRKIAENEYGALGDTSTLADPGGGRRPDRQAAEPRQGLIRRGRTPAASFPRRRRVAGRDRGFLTEVHIDQRLTGGLARKSDELFNDFNGLAVGWRKRSSGRSAGARQAFSPSRHGAERLT